MNVALPSVGGDLGFAPADLSWVFNAYTLAFGGFLLLGGRLADLLGRRRMFMIGLGMFVVASLLGGLAQNAVWLVASRAGQGLGAALVAPAALSLVMTIFAPGPDRNRALGIWGAVAGSGAAAGAILGGVLTDVFGWQAVFLVNIPIGLAAIVLAPRLLPESRDLSFGRGFDLLGAITVTAGLGVLVYALVDANDAGWTSTQTLGLGALAALLLAAFVVVERRSAHPLVPRDFVRHAELRSANIVNVVMAAAIMPSFFFVTLYLQQVLGYSPMRAGFAQLAVALTIMVAAGPAAQLVTRYGADPPAPGRPDAAGGCARVAVADCRSTATTGPTCSVRSWSWVSAERSRSSRSRSRRRPARPTTSPVSRPVCSTPRSRSAVRSGSASWSRSPPVGPSELLQTGARRPPRSPRASGTASRWPPGSRSPAARARRRPDAPSPEPERSRRCSPTTSPSRCWSPDQAG